MTVRSKDSRGAGMQSRAHAEAWLGVSDDILGRFLDVMLVKHRLSLHTCVEYRRVLRNLDRWLQRSEHCSLVTADDEQLVRYLADWVGRRGSLRKLSRVMLAMRRFYAFLCESHARDDNPLLSASMSRWHAAQRSKATTPRVPRATRDAAAQRDRAMLALMIATELHVSHLIALRVSDINLEQAYISVRDQPRSFCVPLGAALVEILRTFLCTHRAALLAGRDSAFAFPTGGGRPLTRREFWCAFRRGAALANERGVMPRPNGWNPTRSLSDLTCHGGA